MLMKFGNLLTGKVYKSTALQVLRAGVDACYKVSIFSFCALRYLSYL